MTLLVTNEVIIFGCTFLVKFFTMADDIDDLLSEVESKFCSKNSTSHTSKNSRIRTPSDNTNKSNGKEDLDDLINEIFDDEGDKKKRRGKKPMTTQSHQSSLRDSVRDGKGSSTSLSTQNNGHPSCFSPLVSVPCGRYGTRCFSAFLGGSVCPQGLSTTVNTRCCDKLRCTDCDFQVVSYDNYQWHSSVDYLFLRNNMPDFPKLKAKLVVKKGSRAYSCQCKWKSVKGEKLLNLQNEADLKWVCGKH